MIQYMLLGDIIRDMIPEHQYYDDIVNLNSKTKKRVVNGLNKANQFKQSKIIKIKKVLPKPRVNIKKFVKSIQNDINNYRLKTRELPSLNEDVETCSNKILEDINKNH